MSINELTSVVSPPKSPTDVSSASDADWQAIEKEMGITFPDDYKEYVMTYGSGLLGNFIVVANPFSMTEGVSLTSVVSMLCNTLRDLKESEGNEEVPFDIYPEVPGLLPWGGDENGNGLYWLTNGEANEWPIVVGAGRDRRWQQFELPMTTFLASTFQGDVVCEIWPEGFSNPERRYAFVSI